MCLIRKTVESQIFSFQDEEKVFNKRRNNFFKNFFEEEFLRK